MNWTMKETRKTALDGGRGLTDHADLDLWPSVSIHASHGSDPNTCKKSRLKVSQFERQSRNRRMDRQTDRGDCITSRAIAVGNNANAKWSGRREVAHFERGIEWRVTGWVLCGRRWGSAWRGAVVAVPSPPKISAWCILVHFCTNLGFPRPLTSTLTSE